MASALWSYDTLHKSTWLDYGILNHPAPYRTPRRAPRPRRMILLDKDICQRYGFWESAVQEVVRGWLRERAGYRHRSAYYSGMEFAQKR